LEEGRVGCEVDKLSVVVAVDAKKGGKRSRLVVFNSCSTRPHVSAKTAMSLVAWDVGCWADCC
jgi:hypothetical protein